DPDRFNDIFALLLSGPGITPTPGLGNQRNIAVLPNAASTTVQIDSVNGTFNGEFFRDNTGGPSVEYDGLTMAAGGGALQARASVQACETYRLKLAIADRGDELFDSGVFVSAVCGGFPSLGLELASEVDYLLEDCSSTPDSLIITYDNEKATPQTYGVTVSGTATPGTDFALTGLGATVVFQPGVNRIAVPILLTADGMDEEEETIELAFTLASDCGPDSEVASLTLRLRDELDLQLANVAENDSVFYCAGSPVELTATGADTYAWAASNGTVTGTGGTVTVTPDGDGTIAVTGTVGTCSETITLELLEATPEVSVLNPDTINICRGDTVTLLQSNNVNDQNITWRPASGFVDDVTAANPRVVPPLARYYAVTVGPEGCAAQDSVWIDVDEFVVPQLIDDTTQCGSTDLLLITEFIEDTGNTIYAWSPDSLLGDTTDVNAILNLPAQPEGMDAVLSLVSTAENGACRDSQSVRVTITPAFLDINSGMDTLFRCDDDGPVTLSAGGGGSYSWEPAVNVVGGSTSSATIEVDPVNPQWYFLDAVINGCPLSDSIHVRTDSLPDDLSMTLDPEKDPYCQGDTFRISSPTYDVGDYPLITHDWIVAPGLESPRELYNAVVMAVDSALFMRVDENGACGDTTEIQ
ncbi:MAG: choice-of-anchor L domain-containing protein, partial [Bacteroidota bacterium]